MLKEYNRSVRKHEKTLKNAKNAAKEEKDVQETEKDAISDKEYTDHEIPDTVYGLDAIDSELESDKDEGETEGRVPLDDTNGTDENQEIRKNLNDED